MENVRAALTEKWGTPELPEPAWSAGHMLAPVLHKRREEELGCSPLTRDILAQKVLEHRKRRALWDPRGPKGESLEPGDLPCPFCTMQQGWQYSFFLSANLSVLMAKMKAVWP